MLVMEDGFSHSLQGGVCYVKYEAAAFSSLG